MSEWAAKRFWRTVTIAPQDGGFGLRLDDRRLKTPAKADLVLPSRALAEAVAAEWDAQADLIEPGSMPLTRAANAAIDKTRPLRAEVVTHLLDYADSDLLCYRAEQPQALVLRQAQLWDPYLDWAAHAFGAHLRPRSGVIHAAQDAAELAALRQVVEPLDAFALTALHELVSLSGSLILGLAAIKNKAPAEEIFEVSRLEELWQIEQWGEDAEALAVAEHRAEAFVTAVQFFRLLTGPDAMSH